MRSAVDLAAALRRRELSAVEALEEPGRRLDVDRVRARHLARQRVGTTGDERQAEVLGG